MTTSETPSANKTSEAVAYYLAGFSKEGEEQTVACPHNELWAIAAKYQRYEKFAMAQAEKGDMEAKEVLEFDPLA